MSESSSSTPANTYKQNLVQIRRAILAMAEAPQNDLEDTEYAELAMEAQELSDYLSSVADSLAVASSPECTAALAKMLDRFKEITDGK